MADHGVTSTVRKVRRAWPDRSQSLHHQHITFNTSACWYQMASDAPGFMVQSSMTSFSVSRENSYAVFN
jgi:hypothetical protein